MKDSDVGGQIEITLAEQAKSKGFENAHHLARESKQTYSVVLKLWEEKATRFDRKTLAALCATLKCQPNKLFRFVPAGKKKRQKTGKPSAK